ncbi:ROK family protein [Niabella drilacis]|uniref:Glucokinase n=1 Tax=Niabella drilacis (strain DSM 25811 / CCM 8410 / CCUG 62505 / LMG 26954 / E90) TaxID=1285928 RepID=A0A1G6X2L2_NIADE|nr:ROK family protein [Niabella drilacis]SDD72348.1 glucokinase [Niabella drilacis]
MKKGISMFEEDQRVVLTLDAGGTNFVFGAMQGNREIIVPLTLPADTVDLENCLSVIVAGFTRVMAGLETQPAAISFAFPGPADYERGIIGDLPNFPSFRGGVALGPFLEAQFRMPVFINNDGNLFAYGEALAGLLPALNAELRHAGSTRQYKNLVALTLGTGFGSGVVINGTLLTGDNGCGGEIWCAAGRKDRRVIAEAGVGVAAVQRSYAERSGATDHFSPKDIYEIAKGSRAGNRDAALDTFHELGRAAGFTIAEMLNTIDGLVVIGGGLAHAHEFILPALMAEMNSARSSFNGVPVPRLPMQVHNLEDAGDRAAFLKDDVKMVAVPGTGKQALYQCTKKSGVALTKTGTSRAIALGAYAFALKQLEP